jgi:hypothetical protein
MQEHRWKSHGERLINVKESIWDINADSCSRYLKSTSTQCWNLSFEAHLKPELKLPFEARLYNRESSESFYYEFGM